jgi:NAD(P)-dependent dehydrogenase (short-subunit alcohol dehydrogenase family)
MALLSYASSTDMEKGIHPMCVELNGKVALITGGTSDVGRATAMLFAQAGTKVVVAGRSASDGEAAVEEIEAAGGTACFVRADLSNAIGFEQLMDKALQAYGRLDVTVDLVE